jgi:VWFA-related protein
MLLAILFFAGTLLAQTPAQTPTDPKFTVRSDLVFLPTRVQTKKGDTIYGLTANQFVVEDNGVRQKVTIDEDPESSGLSLVVLVQCSRSAEAEMKKLKGLSIMIESITGGAPHEVAVIAYGAEPYILGDFSRSNVETQIALTKLRDCGSRFAATIDNVRFAIDMLNRRKTHYRRAILLISEMKDYGSKAKLEDVVAELGVTDTVIYSVAFSPGKNGVVETVKHAGDAYKVPDKYAHEKKEDPKPPPLEEGGVGMVQIERPPKMNWPPQLVFLVNALRTNSASELASLSGGEYLTFSTQKNFDENLQRIANQIHNYYLLSFKPPAGDEWSVHTLKVRVPAYPGAVIQTRKSYLSGKSQ